MTQNEEHTQRSELLTEDKLIELGTRLALGLMASASTKRIDPKQWWERCASALQTAAYRAHDMSGLVSVAARKLQIDVLRKQSASSISSVMDEVRPHFEQFRRYVERESIVIAAMAQIERTEQREAEGERREELKPVWEQKEAERERREALEAEVKQLTNRIGELEEDNRVLKRAVNGGQDDE